MFGDESDILHSVTSELIYWIEIRIIELYIYWEVVWFLKADTTYIKWNKII